jgi:hypothetical protein
VQACAQEQHVGLSGGVCVSQMAPGMMALCIWMFMELALAGRHTTTVLTSVGH